MPDPSLTVTIHPPDVSDAVAALDQAVRLTTDARVVHALANLDRLARYAEDALPLHVCESVAGRPLEERIEAIGGTLAAMRAARARIQSAERDIEDALAAIMREAGHKRWHVDAGTLRYRRGTIRKQWDSHGLALEVVRVGMDRGDIAHPNDVVNAIVSAAGFSYWRVTQLRELGIDADEWCEHEPGRDTVVIDPDEQ